MENQNTNNQGTSGNRPQETAQQNNPQNQQPRQNNHNNRPQTERPRFNNQDKKNGQERNQNYDRNRMNDKNQASDHSQASQDAKGQNDSKYNQKPKERRGFERAKESGKSARYQQNSPGSAPKSNNRNHFAKNPLHNAAHGDMTARHITPKRVDTVEDIQADAERVEKEIQFEIRQIRAAKLGL